MEAIKFRMEQEGLTARNLEPYNHAAYQESEGFELQMRAAAGIDRDRLRAPKIVARGRCRPGYVDPKPAPFDPQPAFFENLFQCSRPQ